MTLIVTLGDPPVRRDERDAEAAAASPIAHARAFGRLDRLAREMRGAGAPPAAVAWVSRQADIAYRAARSECEATRR